MKVKINRATIKSQQKNFEVVKHRKYCKPRSIENELINCQNRYETFYTDGNDEESENSSDSFTSSSEETPDNTPKQVRSGISKKKRPKNKNTITGDEETNRNSIRLISNQWYQPRQDNNINHYIIQPTVEIVQSSYKNIVSRKKKKIVIFIDSILKNVHMEELFQSLPRGQNEPVKLPNNHDAAAIYVVINDLLSSNKSVSDMQRY